MAGRELFTVCAKTRRDHSTFGALCSCAVLLATGALGCRPQAPSDAVRPPTPTATQAPVRLDASSSPSGASAPPPAPADAPPPGDEAVADAGPMMDGHPSSHAVAAARAALTPADAIALATQYVANVMPGSTVAPDGGGARCAEGRGCVWFYPLDEAGFVVAVDDQSRAARIEVHGQAWPHDKLQRYRTTKRAVWAAVNARPEVRSLCDRLRYLASAADFANLKGCLLWLDRFPPDLCVAPRGSDGSGGDESCLWEIYVGENMTDHASRHWTYLVRTEPTRVVAVRSALGGETAAEGLWAEAQRRRATLLRALQSWPETSQLCAGRPGECPSIDEQAECEKGCAWSLRFVVNDSVRDFNVLSDLRGRPTGSPYGDVAGLRKSLAALAPPTAASEAAPSRR